MLPRARQPAAFRILRFGAEVGIWTAEVELEVGARVVLPVYHSNGTDPWLSTARRVDTAEPVQLPHELCRAILEALIVEHPEIRRAAGCLS